MRRTERGQMLLWGLSADRHIGAERIGLPLKLDRRHRSVTRYKGQIIAEAEEAVADRGNQLLMIATGQVRPANGTLEDDIAHDGDL